MVRAIKDMGKKRKSANGYGLMYIADMEDKIHGADRDHWFKFEFNNETVILFPTLKELLVTVSKYLKPTKEYKMGDVYKVTNHRKSRYAELVINTWDFERKSYAYDNGKSIGKGDMMLFVESKKRGESGPSYAVKKDGTLTKIHYVSRRD